MPSSVYIEDNNVSVIRLTSQQNTLRVGFTNDS